MRGYSFSKVKKIVQTLLEQQKFPLKRSVNDQKN